MEDTSRFLIDPNSRDFISKFSDELPMILKWGSGVNRDRFLVYLTLMYDPSSPYRSGNFMTRKYKCCHHAGFTVGGDGLFTDKHLEGCLLGSDSYTNKLTIKYIGLFGHPELLKINAYYSILEAQAQLAMSGDIDQNTDKIIDRVTKALRDESRILLRSGSMDESLALRKALYMDVAVNRLTPEAINSHVVNGTIDDILVSPYGDDYSIDVSKFLDDE